MASKRINSTGRVKILREDIKITLVPDNDGLFTFRALFNLTDYDLPSDASIFVEAYHQTTFMRFAYGTVSSPNPPRHASQVLAEFGSVDGLLFQVKIASNGDRPGMLLAEAKQLSASDFEEVPDKRIPLLPVMPADLGQLVWRVDFSGSDMPKLLLNKRVVNWKATATDATFRSLVYPAAMREILWHILFVEEIEDTDDPDHWASRWLSFVKILGVGNPPGSDADELGEWIEDAVQAFTRTHEMLRHFNCALEAEDPG